MIPLKDLLNKVKWDQREKPEEYVLYYYDRILKQLQLLPYTSIVRMEGTFLVVMKSGEEVCIPMHRVREVRKNNIVIWTRKTS